MAEKSKRRKIRRKKLEESDRIKRMSMFGLRIETRDDFDANNYEDFKNIRREIKDKSHSYRIGPAPVTDYDVRPNHHLTNYPGSLDADLDDNIIEKTLQKECFGKNTSKAGCRGLIMYFSKLGYLDDENVDLEFIDSLLRGGADINFPDRHGQTCLHEIARGWHTDVAQFALSRGAEIDKGDNYGRTPLHLAAAVNYPEMVFWLISNGAKIDARTTGEQQTPTHYAAKNNAEDSLKVLLHMGSNINDVDYKDRTPLYLAAETGRAEACRFLLELGAPSGVYDDAGTSALTLMVEKMPDVAKIALGQFEMVDKALRKKYYYLNYLESDVWKKKNASKDALKMRTSHARTPLEAICAYNETELIMHSVILRLIAVKWRLFGKYYTAINTGINLIYTILWTILGVTMPKTEVKYYYTPLSQNAWRIVLELIGVTLTIYFIVVQVLDFRRNEKHTRQYKDWKTGEIERDMQYCHDRWPEERRYLNSEVKMIGRASPSYFKNGWNVFEMCTSVVMAFVVFTRIAASAASSDVMDRIHYKSFPLLLIMLWLRFMRSCQCYQSLGPFITMLGHVITDTMKFGFLFFEFFIPYVCAFWILFGGVPETEFEKFNDVVYQVFLMTLVDEYERTDIMNQDKVMGQILVGTYLAIASVVCVNLYIALMSQTFTRIYQNAKATAFMQQAKHLLKTESTLGKKQKDRVKTFMTEGCSPLVIYDNGISNDSNADDNNKLMMYRVLSSVTEIKDKLLVLMMNTETAGKSQEEPETSLKDISLQVETVKKQCDNLQSELEDIKELLSETKEYMSSVAAADHTQLANMSEIKEIVQQILPLQGGESQPSEDTDRANVDDLIEKVVGVISQSFMKSEERSKKSSGQSDYVKRHPSYDRYDAPPTYPKFDDEIEYRSVSSDSFSSYMTPQRSAVDPFTYSRDEHALAKEFEEFKKFKRSKTLLNYEKSHRRQKMSTSSSKPYFHRESRGHRSRYGSGNYDTDDGIIRMNRSRTPNVVGTSSLPRQGQFYRSQSAFDYYDDGSDNREMIDLQSNFSGQQEDVWKSRSVPTRNRTNATRKRKTTPEPQFQKTYEGEDIDTMVNQHEEKSPVSGQRDETCDVTSPSEPHPTSIDHDDVTSQTTQNKIEQTTNDHLKSDFQDDSDEKIVQSILARKENCNSESSSDEKSDVGMGNVKSLLKQYGITLPGCNQLPHRSGPMDLDTNELKRRISASLWIEKNNVEESNEEERPNGQIPVATGNAFEVESDKDTKESSPLIELQVERVNFSPRRHSSASKRNKYNNMRDTRL